MKDPGQRRSRRPTQPHYEIQIPPDLSPEDVLEIVVGLSYEMRHPINKIEDWATVLSDPHSKALHESAIQDILLWVDGLRYILNIIYAYDAQRNTPIAEEDDE